MAKNCFGHVVNRSGTKVLNFYQNQIIWSFLRIQTHGGTFRKKKIVELSFDRATSMVFSFLKLRFINLNKNMVVISWWDGVNHCVFFFFALHTIDSLFLVCGLLWSFKACNLKIMPQIMCGAFLSEVRLEISFNGLKLPFFAFDIDTT